MVDMSKISINSIPVDLFMKYFNEKNLKENIDYVMTQEKDYQYKINSITFGISNPAFNKDTTDINELTIDDINDVVEKTISASSSDELNSYISNIILANDRYSDSQDFLSSIGVNLLDANKSGTEIAIKSISYEKTDTSDYIYRIHDNVLSESTAYPFYISYPKTYDINGEIKSFNTNYHRVKLFKDDYEEIHSFDDISDYIGYIKIRVYNQLSFNITGSEIDINISNPISTELSNMPSTTDANNNYTEYDISIGNLYKYNFGPNPDVTTDVEKRRFMSNLDPEEYISISSSIVSNGKNYIKTKGHFPDGYIAIFEHPFKLMRKKDVNGNFLVLDATGREIPLTRYTSKMDRFANAVRTGFYALHGDKKVEEKIDPYICGGIFDEDGDSARLYWYEPSVRKETFKFLDGTIAMYNSEIVGTCTISEGNANPGNTVEFNTVNIESKKYYKYVECDYDAGVYTVKSKAKHAESGGSDTYGSLYNEPNILYVSDIKDDKYSYTIIPITHEKISNELYDKLITNDNLDEVNSSTSVKNTKRISNPIIHLLQPDYSSDFTEVTAYYTEDGVFDYSSEVEADDRCFYLKKTDINKIQSEDTNFIKMNFIRTRVSKIGGCDVSGLNLKIDPVKQILYFDDDEGSIHLDMKCDYHRQQYDEDGDITDNSNDRTRDVLKFPFSVSNYDDAFKHKYLRIYEEKRGDTSNLYVCIPVLYHKFSEDYYTDNNGGIANLLDIGEGNNNKGRHLQDLEKFAFYEYVKNDRLVVNTPLRLSFIDKTGEYDKRITLSIGLDNENKAILSKGVTSECVKDANTTIQDDSKISFINKKLLPSTNNIDSGSMRFGEIASANDILSIYDNDEHFNEILKTVVSQTQSYDHTNQEVVTSDEKTTVIKKYDISVEEQDVNGLTKSSIVERNIKSYGKKRVLDDPKDQDSPVSYYQKWSWNDSSLSVNTINDTESDVYGIVINADESEYDVTKIDSSWLFYNPEKVYNPETGDISDEYNGRLMAAPVEFSYVKDAVTSDSGVHRNCELKYFAGYFKIAIELSEEVCDNIIISRGAINNYENLKDELNRNITISNVIFNKYTGIDGVSEGSDKYDAFYDNAQSMTAAPIYSNQTIPNIFRSIVYNRGETPVMDGDSETGLHTKKKAISNLYFGARNFYRRTPIILLDSKSDDDIGTLSIASDSYSKFDVSLLDKFKYNIYYPYLRPSMVDMDKENILEKVSSSEDFTESEDSSYGIMTSASAIIAVQDTNYANPKIIIRETIDTPTNKANSTDDADYASDNAILKMLRREKSPNKGDKIGSFSSPYIESFEEHRNRLVKKGHLNWSKYTSAAGSYVGTSFYDVLRKISKTTLKTTIDNKRTILNPNLNYTDNSLIENYIRIKGMGDLIINIDVNKDRQFRVLTGESGRIILSKEHYDDTIINNNDTSNINYSPSSPYVRLLEYEKYPLNEIRNKILSTINNAEESVKFDGTKTTYSNFFENVDKSKTIHYRTRYEKFGEFLAVTLADLYSETDKSKVYNNYSNYFDEFFIHSDDNKNIYEQNEEVIKKSRLYDDVSEKKVFYVSNDNKKSTCSEVMSLLKTSYEDDDGNKYKWVIL